jgi:hypothetical protein
MKLREENASDLTVEQTFEAHCEQAVREQACRESGALSWDVQITRDGDRARVQVERLMPPSVPDFVKKFVGDSIAVRQIEEWQPPDSDGARVASVKLTIKGQPASMLGTVTITPAGSGSVEVVEGDVKVAVPFIGKKIEPEIVKVIGSGVRVEQRVVVAWVHANR